MTKIVWLASYPRSGNTWLRFLLGNFIYGNIESSNQLAYTIPDIHRFVNGRHLLGPDRCYIKTHWAWQPGFPLREDTEAVVYLVRNPVDVMESALNYALRGSGEFARNAPEADIDKFARSYVARYLEFGGYGAWYREGYGSWESNAASWIEQPLRFRRLVLRYESLKDDTATFLTDVVTFLGLDPDPDRVTQAVERSSAERLAAMEDAEIRDGAAGLFYGRQAAQSSAAGLRFVGRAEAGGRIVTLTAAERDRAGQRFAAAMARFGYAVR